MKKHILKKSLIIGIIIVFICSNFVSSISGFSKDTIKLDVDFKSSYESQEKVLVSCQAVGIPEKSLKQIEMLKTEAEKLLVKIDDFAKIIADDPLSDEVIQLQGEIICDAKKYNLLPKDISLEALQSRLFVPHDIKHQKKGIIPVIGNRATALFCNFATTGEGSQFPIIILPRMIPILLTPIPRTFLHWSANEGFTTCGSYLTGTGFIAAGMQRGTALGFWGIGFSVFLPPVMAYGFIGYALLATCTAEEMEPWPPNYAPEVSAVSPVDGDEDVAISTSELSFRISDRNGDRMDYSISTTPDIGSGGENNKLDGTYSIPISGLEGSEEYTWNVKVTDGQKTVESSFSFETEPVAPIVCDPNPKNGERYVPVDLYQLSFHLKDPQGDLMDYTVETSPDIGTGSNTGVGDGIYSISIDGLDYSQEYKWYVNVTDGENWKHMVYCFQADHKKVFDPFEDGWKYRKKINIDHTKVKENLTNFPVLISTTDSDLRYKVQYDGDDILFMDGPGVANRMYHEIDIFEVSTGELSAWVNVNNLTSEQDTILYMYYGNQSSCSQESPEMVWDSNYVGVWHMGETSGNIRDSTGTKDGAVVGSPDYQETGKIGKCIYFDGDNNEYFDIVDDTYKFNSEDVTFEFWVYFVENRNMHEPPIYFGDNDNVPSLTIHKVRSEYPNNNGGKLFSQNRFNQEGEIAWSSEGEDTYVGHWIYLIGRFERGVETSLWINGQKEPNAPDSCNNNDLSSSSQYLARIGRAGVGGGSYMPNSAHIYLDEVRVSKNKARSDTWISTSYNNQNDPTDFLSFEPEEFGP